MSEILMIASGKGGVGKTTATAFLGTELSRMDKSVVMIDTDFGLRNLDLHFSLDQKIVYNIVDVLEGTCSLRQALIPLEPSRKLYILPGSKDYRYCLSQSALVHVLQELTKDFDDILIDTPAGISDTHLKILPCVTEVLLVTTLTDASIRDAITMGSVIKKYGVPTRILFNRISKTAMAHMENRHLLYLSQDVFQMESIGVFPYIGEYGMHGAKKIQRSLQQICTQI